MGIDEGIAQEPIWKAKPRDHAAEIDLAQRAGIHSLVAAVLRGRGYLSAEQVSRFLDSDLDSLMDPFDLPDMQAAAERIVLAVGQDEPILVHGDYDADGITSTALLVRFLSKLGADVHYFIPHRIHDRYGLMEGAVERAVEKGIRLILAVDCGVSDIAAIARANELGAEVIVIDHHEPGPELPDALVVDPKREDASGDHVDLAAVGLAYKVAAAVCTLLDMPVNSLRRAFFDLVAIGTVADVSPLTGDNRTMVKYGLQLLSNTQKVGLRALMDISGLDGDLTAQDIGFRLAPKLNAVGRMADATDAVDLLLAADADEAMRLAVRLEGHNRERQRVQEAIYCTALAKIAVEVDLEHDPVIVLASDDWHIGVIGIVASKVVEDFNRPAFLMGRDRNYYRGSARSVDGFTVAEALEECSDLLVRFGGHSLAGGFTLDTDGLAAFRERINAIGRRVLRPQHLCATVNVDCEVDIEEIDADLVESLRQMGPFGQGNPEPVLMSTALEVVDARCVGNNGAHLKLLAGREHLVFDCIGFRLGELADSLRKGTLVDIAYTPEFNDYNGRRGIQLRLAAVRAAHPRRRVGSP